MGPVGSAYPFGVPYRGHFLSCLSGELGDELENSPLACNGLSPLFTALLGSQIENPIICFQHIWPRPKSYNIRCHPASAWQSIITVIVVAIIRHIPQGALELMIQFGPPELKSTFGSLDIRGHHQCHLDRLSLVLFHL